jgi:hypothetical protein
VRPVFEDEQRPLDDRRVVGRDLQLIDGLIEARIGVDVRAEPHAGRLQKRDHILLREVTRAVEAHVLDEVCEPALVVVLENRAGIDDEAELGASLRLLILAEVVAKTVRQRADGDPRIDRDFCRQRHVLRARPNGALSCDSAAGRNGHGQRQNDRPNADADAKEHEVLQCAAGRGPAHALLSFHSTRWHCSWTAGIDLHPA